MLTTDNQRCAAALECYQEAPELRVQGAGRDVVLKEVRLTLDGGARLHPALKQRGGQAVPRSQAARCFPCGGARRRQRKRNSRACSPSRRLCIDRTSAICFMAGPRPRKQLLGGSSARRDFAALTACRTSSAIRTASAPSSCWRARTRTSTAPTCCCCATRTTCPYFLPEQLPRRGAGSELQSWAWPQFSLALCSWTASYRA